ncbi:MAG: hypothetical protein E7773_11855 [Sphingomonas sp.]|uniref:DUF6975 family protein n=1 Tax=Sphingomonas sp. TaxID=28214 RepID=UPI00121EE5FE|nr:hypothetical protein [Sphingomonas sp.]THD35143.1 MAG: hypothetical protein E7773_11855 [Sphingomonas sp.]
MSVESVPFDRQSGSWSVLAALAEADGSAHHPFVQAMSARGAATRDLADAIHLLCALHGRQPGVIDHALAHGPNAIAESWLDEAAYAFADERALLARLTAAAGPIPSTPGQAESEAAVTHQLHALDMLAQSDRTGCAVGAAIALVLDWRAIRHVLEAAADRAGFAPLPSTLPIDADTATLAATIAADPAIERAMSFGAQQLLAQHRALWDLADARKSARDRH